MAIVQSKYPDKIPPERRAITEWREKVREFFQNSEHLCTCDKTDLDIVHPETQTSTDGVRVNCKRCGQRWNFDLEHLSKMMEEHDG